MTWYRSEKSIWIATIAAASCLIVLVVLLAPRRNTLKPGPPPAILSFVGLSNLPPLGMMTAFRISNSSPATLTFVPQVVRYRGSGGTSSVPVATIANCAGILSPGGTYVFFVPAIVTNRSLAVGLICRGKARTGTLGDIATRLFEMANGGKAGVWLGAHYSGVITEVDGTQPPRTPADVRAAPAP